MNSENSKTTDPHRSNKLREKWLNMLLYQTLALTTHGKI